MKRIIIVLFLFGLVGCCPYKNVPIIRYWENEAFESLGVADDYSIYDFASPFKGIMDHYEEVSAHYQILLPPREDIKNILFGPEQDRCFFFTRNRGIAIIQDLQDWEKQCENGLQQISPEAAMRHLSRFEDEYKRIYGKRRGIKVKKDRLHYVYVDNEIRIVMFNLTREDYYKYVEFPLANLKIRRIGGVRIQEKYGNEGIN